MKIALILLNPGMGGAERRFLRLAKYLTERNQDINLIIGSQLYELVEKYPDFADLSRARRPQ